MEFVKLRYLIAVAEQRSFSKAAEKCFVSQPTLTRCVQNMEKSLGVSLFDRSCSPIQLTPAGEKYVAGVREILALKEKLDNEMAELTDRRQEDAARRALDAVRRAEESLSLGMTPDVILTDAEEALSALGELTGATAREEIVSAIFSRFCVGK